MKEQILSVTAAARGFSDLVNRVRYRGDSAVLTKNGVPVARLIPVGPARITGGELAQRWKPGTTLTPKEVDDFARDIEEGRRFFKPYVSSWD